MGAGDRFIAQALAEADAAGDDRVNKVDRLDRAATVAVLAAAAELDVGEEIFPISARTGKGVARARRAPCRADAARVRSCSPHRHLRPAASVLLAELVREAAIKRTFQELPHAVEAIVEEIEHPREGLVRVRALIWVESESQKGIVVGAGGRMIKAIGSAARKEIERELDCHVHLDLSVRVRRDWRGDEGLLDRLGIT